VVELVTTPPSDPDYPPGPLVSTPESLYRDGDAHSLLSTTSTPDSLADVLDLIPGTVIAQEDTR
jgi:hypothetical protein